MSPLIQSTLLIITALFPIVNPLGSAPIFLSLTHYYTAEQRKILSWRIALNSFALLVASYFVGTHILAFFGISLPVVQVGGGLVVATTGWAILKQKDDEPPPNKDVQGAVDMRGLFQQAFYPLTLPLTVGPGSISIAITLGANEPHGTDRLLYAVIGAVIGSFLIAVSVYFCYAFSDRLARVLGATSMSVIMRLSAFLLVCIGVQIIWNGTSALLKNLLNAYH
ncbi:MAG: MarC family protein [Candidatus Acidiferrum sp.]